MTLRELTEHMDRDQLRDMLLDLNSNYLEFESYLINELGIDTYIDLSKGFAAQKAASWMRDRGMSEDSIDEFNEMMGSGLKEFEA